MSLIIPVKTAEGKMIELTFDSATDLRAFALDLLEYADSSIVQFQAV